MYLLVSCYIGNTPFHVLIEFMDVCSCARSNDVSYHEYTTDFVFVFVHCCNFIIVFIHKLRACMEMACKGSDPKSTSFNWEGIRLSHQRKCQQGMKFEATHIRKANIFYDTYGRASWYRILLVPYKRFRSPTI